MLAYAELFFTCPKHKLASKFISMYIGQCFQNIKEIHKGSMPNVMLTHISECQLMSIHPHMLMTLAEVELNYIQNLKKTVNKPGKLI